MAKLETLVLICELEFFTNMFFLVLSYITSPSLFFQVEIHNTKYMFSTWFCSITS